MELTKLPEDMSSEEKQSLIDYKKNGCPGLLSVKESEVFKWFKLYMSGKTYTEISKLLNIKKPLILYISEKAKWHQKRLQHYENISDELINKFKIAKIGGANTVSSIITALTKYYGKKFNKFLSDGDDRVIETVNIKLLAQYYKSLELLDKLMIDALEQPISGNSNKSPTPIVNVNVNSGAKVEQIDNNTLEITNTDNDQAAGELLKALAKFKKSQSNS